MFPAMRHRRLPFRCAEDNSICRSLVLRPCESERWGGWRHSRGSGNPDLITDGFCLKFLDARLREHDEIKPFTIMRTEYQWRRKAPLNTHQEGSPCVA